MLIVYLIISAPSIAITYSVGIQWYKIRLYIAIINKGITPDCLTIWIIHSLHGFQRLGFGYCQKTETMKAFVFALFVLSVGKSVGTGNYG